MSWYVLAKSKGQKARKEEARIASGPQGPLYHGTDAQVAPHELRTRNKSRNSWALGDFETERHGLFLTDNPDFARQYGKNVHTFERGPSNPAVLDRLIKEEFIETLDPWKERDLWLRATHARNDWSFFETELGERFVAFLKSQGYDGAVFNEATGTPDGGEVEGKTYVAFENPLKGQS